MNDTGLCCHVLGLEAPLQVTDVRPDITDESVRVWVGYDPGEGRLVCPGCREARPVYDRREHGVQTVRACWCEPNSRVTALFERYAIALLPSPDSIPVLGGGSWALRARPRSQQRAHTPVNGA